MEVSLSYVSLALQSNAGHGRHIIEVSRSQAMTHQSQLDSSERAIGSSQTPLPDNIKHSQEANIHAPSGIRNRNPSQPMALDPRLRRLGQWDRGTFQPTDLNSNTKPHISSGKDSIHLGQQRLYDKHVILPDRIISHFGPLNHRPT